MGVTRAVAAASMLLAAVGAVEAASAGAAQAASGPKPIQLVLTVAKGDSTQPAQRRASLRCQPAGGSHHQAREACAQLARVGGRFDKLQLGGGLCTMQWDPVTVTASGRWKGRKVAYQHTFGNACTLQTTTGPVFSL
ncbi:SSI family serine proteinase inhibitor [Dactylosporangium sp. CA-233914]|uniref:SSI family serine proteinase inhibitor n=1 Tax=Dactylosporangium sp. CA-233914 TaxID=3239934 RepID=UPI003D8E1AC8